VCVNLSAVRRMQVFRQLPLDRLLTETDHPFGDRANGKFARPGNVARVEHAVGSHHGIDPTEVRARMWANLACLVTKTGVASLLPRPIRLQLMAVRA
jgi:TatD DNase family protein